MFSINEFASSDTFKEIVEEISVPESNLELQIINLPLNNTFNNLSFNPVSCEVYNT